MSDEQYSITSIEVQPGGLLLVLDGGATVRPVPWPELREVYAREYDLTLWWAPSAVDLSEHARYSADWPGSEIQHGGYWPGEETLDTPDEEWREPVAAMVAAIRDGWREWAGRLLDGYAMTRDGAYYAQDDDVVDW